MMIRNLLALAIVLAATTAAHSQVYRCAGDRLYTDKPCDGAKPVDLRANILDAGPRGFPAADVPQPALILPDRSQPQAQPQASSGSIFDRRESSDAEYKSRTGPFPAPR